MNLALQWLTIVICSFFFFLFLAFWRSAVFFWFVFLSVYFSDKLLQCDQGWPQVLHSFSFYLLSAGVTGVSFWKIIVPYISSCWHKGFCKTITTQCEVYSVLQFFSNVLSLESGSSKTENSWKILCKILMLFLNLFFFFHPQEGTYKQFLPFQNGHSLLLF